jgi:hypothetical protein
MLGAFCGTVMEPVSLANRVSKKQYTTQPQMVTCICIALPTIITKDPIRLCWL